MTKWVMSWYQVRVGTELRKYGLRWEDLYDPEADVEVAEALRRLPKEVTDARIQRLKRASDLSMKHTYLSEEMQAKQTPFESYLQEMLDKVHLENIERKNLGFTPKNQRQLP
eukprot:g3397.t1